MSTTIKSVVDASMDRFKPVMTNVISDLCRGIEHSIRFSTFVCADCGQIIWPKISIDDEGFVTVASERIYTRDADENPTCEVCRKAKYEKRLSGQS